MQDSFLCVNDAQLMRLGPLSRGYLGIRLLSSLFFFNHVCLGYALEDGLIRPVIIIASEAYMEIDNWTSTLPKRDSGS
jgi:hypothetical protein